MNDNMDMLEIEDCLSTYKTKLSSNLTKEEKQRLMWRIRTYRSQHYPLLDDNPVSQFHELEGYWEKDTVSALELMVLLSELYKDVGGVNQE